jgi:hypothetical protein
MRSFMDRDREDHGEGVDQNGLNDIVKFHAFIVAGKISFAALMRQHL